MHTKGEELTKEGTQREMDGQIRNMLRGHHLQYGRAAKVSHSPVIRTFLKNDVCLMPTACLTSCLELTKSGRTVARLVLSKLSQCQELPEGFFFHVIQ